MLSLLYDYLADIVHAEYQPDEETISVTIPHQINTVIAMVETIRLPEKTVQRLLSDELMYMFIIQKEVEAVNEKGDYSDKQLLEFLINRFQTDAERTRIFLELRERDWEAIPYYLEADF